MSRRAQLLTGLAALLASLPAPAQNDTETLFVDVRQGTDLSVTSAPGIDFIVVELLGRLWRMPVSGGAATPLTPPDVAVRHPRMNQDGDRVVYQRLGTDGWDIWVTDLNSTAHTAVTDAPGHEREPDFLNNGEGVIFSAARAGSYDLWSVSLQNAAAPWQPVTSEPGDARFPAVADNGAIAYVVQHDGTSTLRTRAAGRSQIVYQSRNSLSAPSWRPAGGVIIFQERAGAGGARLQMALLAPELLVRELTPDEDLFASRVGWIDANEFLYAADGQIWRRRLAGRARAPVHLFATAAVTPPQRPGRTLESPLSVSGVEFGNATRDGTARVIAVAGEIWLIREGVAEPLTNDAVWDEAPLIDADGRFVIYARNHNGTRRLWQLWLDSSAPARALTPAGVRAFAAALDPSGDRLAWMSSASGFSEFAPAHLHTLHLADGSRRQSAAALRVLAPPVWLTDNRTASLSVNVQQPDGSSRSLMFDAALQIVDNAAPAQPLSAAAGVRAQAPELPASVLAGLNAQSPAAQRRLVIQAGRLFDGIGTGYARHVDIHIEAGRIAAVVSRGRLPLPDTVIDATELTVVPGFIDLHVHDSGLLGELAGRAWLAWGVTMVRSVGPHTANQRALAAAWNSGFVPGPRFIEARPAVQSAATQLTLQPPALLDDPFVTLPGEVPEIELADTLLPPLQPPHPLAVPRRYSPGFAHYQDVFALVTAAGATEITSLGAFAPSATNRLLAGDPALRRVFEQLFSAADRAHWRSAQPLVAGLAARQTALSRLLRAGGRVAVGTESPHMPPGLGEHIELELLAAAGIPNDQVLRAATSSAALALGLEAEIGTVEAGRRADLVVIAGDPLNDMAATRAIRAVVRDGVWLERNALIDPAAATN